MTLHLTPVRIIFLIVFIAILVIGVNELGDVYWSWRDHVDAISR